MTAKLGCTENLWLAAKEKNRRANQEDRERG